MWVGFRGGVDGMGLWDGVDGLGCRYLGYIVSAT